jgi:hypothetical protein
MDPVNSISSVLNMINCETASNDQVVNGGCLQSNSLDPITHSSREDSRDAVNKNEELDMPSFLRSWALEYNISHMAFTSLLKFLKHEHPQLPSSSRTLLKTCYDYNIKHLDSGDYMHFGFNGLLQTILPIVYHSGNSDIHLMLMGYQYLKVLILSSGLY